MGGAIQCGHVGRYWKIPIWPWIKPHWYCRHCGSRVSNPPESRKREEG